MAQMRHCCVVIRCICLSRRMNHGVRRNAKSKAEIKLQPRARRANNERGSKGSDCGNNDKIGRVAVARSLVRPFAVLLKSGVCSSDEYE